MKFRKIALQANDLNALQQFYSSVLELPVRCEGEKTIAITTGETELLFEEVKDSKPFYHFAINIPSNKIDEAKQWLESKLELLWIKDYKSEIADFKGWSAKSIYFYDPAGNILELIARFDLNDEVDEKFSSKHFNCISEVGIVFNADKFDYITNKFLEKFHLNYFSKQLPLPHFRAVGDDNGLFIIVPEKRNWYPTDRPAGIFPMEIEFQNGDRFLSIKFETHRQ